MIYYIINILFFFFLGTTGTVSTSGRYLFHYTLACYIYSYFCIKYLLTLILFLSMQNVEKWFVNDVF